MKHIIESHEKNAIIFTFDLTNPQSFKSYLKKAVKDFIFSS